MTDAPIPADEDQRLRALWELGILDTPPAPIIDRIAAFTAEEFELPIALVSLVDSDRQWIKANVGLDITETPRAVSFCGHAIAEAGVFVVEDTHADERFADNPMVTGSPGIRFYAGAPLKLRSGEAVGTLCVIGTSPRGFSPAEQATLAFLSELVVEQIACVAEAV